LNGGLAGQALVEHAAKPVDIGPPIGRLGGDLLGRRVVDGAREVGAAGGTRFEVGGAGEPEIGQVTVLLAALLGDEHVGGLDVTVDEIVLVGGVERVGDLVDELERPGGLKRPLLLEERRQVGALHVAHGDP
jgi:hypothetical protein